MQLYQFQADVENSAGYDLSTAAARGAIHLETAFGGICEAADPSDIAQGCPIEDRASEMAAEFSSQGFALSNDAFNRRHHAMQVAFIGHSS